MVAHRPLGEESFVAISEVADIDFVKEKMNSTLSTWMPKVGFDKRLWLLKKRF